MKFLTYSLKWRPWKAKPANRNIPDGHIEDFRRFHDLMDRIDANTPQGVLDCACLARALTDRGREAGPADEVEVCLQAFILFVALHSEGEEGRNLVTVRELLADPDALLGTIVLMADRQGPGANHLRLFARRLGLWAEDRRAAVARRCLAFLPRPRPGKAT